MASEIAASRALLLASWENAVESENQRHQTILSRANAVDADALQPCGDGSALLFSMDEQIAVLTQEVDSCCQIKTEIVQVSTDDEVSDLQLALEGAKSDSIRRIQSAQEEKAAVLSEKRGHLDFLLADYFQSLELEKISIDGEISEKSRAVEAAKAEFSETCESTLKRLSRELGSSQICLQSRKIEISNLRAKLLSKLHKLQICPRELPTNVAANFSKAQQKMKRKYDFDVRELDDEFNLWRTAQDELRHNIDVQLAAAGTRKEHAKFVFLDRFSRDEDISLITSLEKQLDILSKEFTQNVRELVQFKSRFHSQETAYNSRFGQLRSVAVIGGDPHRGHNSSLSLSVLPKFLPKHAT
jgi:hypothetical protein